MLKQTTCVTSNLWVSNFNHWLRVLILNYQVIWLIVETNNLKCWNIHVTMLSSDRCQPIKICILHLTHFFCYYHCIYFALNCCLLIMCVHTITDKLDNLDGLNKLVLESGTNKDSCDYIALENVVPACDKDLTILQVNIRGIQSKIGELKYLIDHCYKNTTLDIILICKTWLTPNSPQVTIAGYKFFHRDWLG